MLPRFSWSILLENHLLALKGLSEDLRSISLTDGRVAVSHANAEGQVRGC